MRMRENKLVAAESSDSVGAVRREFNKSLHEFHNVIAISSKMMLDSFNPSYLVLVTFLLSLISPISMRPPQRENSRATVENLDPDYISSKLERFLSEEPGERTNLEVTAILEEFESRLSRLERRLRAVEQPVWQTGSGDEDWEVCAKGPCRCRPETKSISCWRYGLPDLPAGQLVPKDVFKLDLGGNRLTALHRDTFLDMTRLNHLDLSENLIEHLPLNLFFSLHGVAHLRISKNLLREFQHNQFLRTRNLRILDASSNRLRGLPGSLFASNNLLTVLDLSSNRISLMPADSFVGLRNLEELLLGKNRLITLPSTIFRGLVNLRYLGLEENRLKELGSDIFLGQNLLRELTVRDNQLTEIGKNLFLSLERLVSLEISNNRITRIDPSGFHGLISLRELRMGRNRIKELPVGLFEASGYLERLVLYGNDLENLSAGVFRGLSNLTILFLHSNHLRIMHPDIFADTPRLRKLQLESNYLSYLPTRIFDWIPEVEQLRLARNPWHCDCSASYLAVWLQKRYRSRGSRGNSSLVDTEETNIWDHGAGAVCRGPGTLGGKLILRLTFHELCEGQWASMKGLVPRVPVELMPGFATTGSPKTTLPSV